MKYPLLLAALLLGCSSSPSDGGDRGGSSGTPTAPITVPPPAAGSDAAVFVRARIEGDSIVAEIVTRATPGLSGAALRLAFPSWMQLDRREPDTRWVAQSVHHTKTDANEVVLADLKTGKGIAHPAPPNDGESILTTLYFTRTSAPEGDPGVLHLVPARSELRDGDGKIVPVRFYDQTFAR